MKECLQVSRKAKRVFALFMSFSMIIASGNTFAYANAEEIHNDEATIRQTNNKLDAALYDEWSANGKASIIVVMKEQLDANKMEKKAMRLSSMDELSNEDQEIEVRDYIVTNLKEETEQIQENLIDYIEKEKANGNVEDYRSFFIVNSIAMTTTKEVAEKIAEYPEVEKIVLDKVYELPPVEEEPDNKEFTLTDVRQSEPQIPWNLKSISQDKVKAEGIDGTGVVVGIIDSGVDGDHPALQSGWRGNEAGMAQYSWFDLDSKNKSDVPDDIRGHGTHVCGTIMGRQDADGNMLGVAPGAKWMAARVFTDEGASQSDLVAAAQWMLAPTDESGTPHPEHAPDIINNSWGGGANDDEFFKEILKKWRAAGIVPVFSAGNASRLNPATEGSIHAPASHPEAFTVGALKRDDGLAKFSLRGSFGDPNVKPDISAPGVNIRSSMPEGKYALMTGTSMACPHVAGAFALLKQAKPDATVDEMEKALRETATPLTDEYFVDTPNPGYGYGKINVYNAMKKLKPTDTGVDATTIGTLSGHIYKNGTDNDNPEIKHAPIKQMFSSAPSTPVEAQVSDASGIKEVTLSLKAKGAASWTEELPMKLAAGTKKSGTYLVEISKDKLDPAGMEYQIKAVDVTNKEIKTDVFAAEVTSGITIGYNQDFEDNTDGIEFGGNTPIWEWGTPTSGPNQAASGVKCLGTNLDGNYKGMTDAIFVLPIIDLSDEKTGGKRAALSFKHFYDMGNYEYANYETAEVWIAEATKEPLQYKQVRSYKNSNGKWDEEYIDLGQYKGKQIYVMFGVRGLLNAEQENDGWYVDDITIKEASQEKPETPSEYLDFRYRASGDVEVSFSPLKNPSVTSYVLYRATQKDGPFTKVYEEPKETAGKYTVSLMDTPLPQTGTYYYRATAKIGENESEPTQTFSHTFTAGEEKIKIDFENDNAGWTSTPDSKGNEWTYGAYTVPDSLPENQIGSKPAKEAFKGKNGGTTEGLKIWATVPNEYRQPGATYTLESNTMDLSSVTNGKLYFQNWFNTRGRKGMVEEYGSYNNYDEDQGFVYFSKDNGGTWNKVFSLDDKALKNAGEDNQHRIVNGWYTEGIDIPAEYQTAQFKVKFELVTGANRNEADCGGWYIDDVMIATNTNSVPAQTEVAQADADQTADVAMADEHAAPFVLQNMKAADVDTIVFSDAKAEPQVSLPLDDATVTILETGTVATTETGTGAYTMKHPVGTYTAVVEAEGYQPQKHTIEIGKDPITKDFTLGVASNNQITVQAVNTDGEPIPNVNAILTKQGTEVEDAIRKTSDGSGNITIPDVYAGEYVIHLSASGYDSVEKSATVVEGENCDLGQITLKKTVFAGTSEEKKYDDGQPESYLNTLGKGQIAGVKIKNDQKVLIENISIMFGSSTTRSFAGRQSSAGRPFEYAIYEGDQFDGYPGRRLLDFTKATVTADNAWTTIQLPDPIVVEGDFYVAYRQQEDIENSALLAIDDDSKGSQNARMANGAWQVADETGAYMMRATVKPVTAEPDKVITTVSPSSSSINVKENAKVLEALKNSGIKVTINYDSGAPKQVALKDYLTGADVKLDGAVVDASTAFTKQSKKINIAKEGQAFDIMVTVQADGGIVPPPPKPDPKPDPKPEPNPDNSGSNGSGGSNGGGGSSNGGGSSSGGHGHSHNNNSNNNNKKPSVTIGTAIGGTVNIDNKSAKAGDTVTITTTAKQDYVLDKVVVTDKNGKEVKVTKKSEGTYTFIMPDTAITVRAEFDKIPEVATEVPNEVIPFEDVKKTDWFYDSVMTVYAQKLMSGVTKDTFAPNAKTTRGMIVTILYRLEGSPEAEAATNFKDVDNNQYYAKAIAWASKNGIVSGFDETTFGPNNDITREQLASILYRYAKFKGMDITTTDEHLDGFKDKDKILSYAAPALNWAVEHKIMSGKGDAILDPTGQATRAEVATMLVNFTKK